MNDTALRSLLLIAIATFALLTSANGRIRLELLETYADLATLDRNLDEIGPHLERVHLDLDPDTWQDSTTRLALASIEIVASENHPRTTHPYPATAILEAMRGDERVAWDVGKGLARGKRSTSFDLELRIPSDADALRLTYFVRQLSGPHSFASQSLKVTKPGPWYLPAVFIACALWIAVAIDLSALLHRQIGARGLLIAGICLGGIIVSVTLLDVSRLFQRTQLAELFRENTSLLSSVGISSIAKLGHFVMFSILGAAMWLGRARLELTALQLLIALILFAIASEASQLHLVDRTGKPADVLIDMVGAGTGILMTWVVLKISFFVKRPNYS